ncbi:MAG: hemerythrin family protein [Sulfurihydrogenibium sp.]|jgi:hemerythrin|nr:hemerythrin family protein [Sulfurihydrogenibium sp.]
MIEFDDNLLTHVKEMDNQHVKLVELLNKTYDLLKEGKRNEAVRLFKNEIIAYTEHHLSEEEKFMEEIGYPELEQHKKVHELFRKEIHNLAPHVENGDPKAFKQALSLAWGWLYNHIAKTDKKYGIYAKEKGLI